MIIDMPTVSMGNSGSILPAEQVSYDNTSSGLEAENVQDAVDEINSNLGEHYNNEEMVVGTWNGITLYRKGYFINSLPQSGIGAYPAGLTNVLVKRVYGNFYGNNCVYNFPHLAISNNAIVGGVGLYFSEAANEIHIPVTSDRSNYSAEVFIEYVKN